MIGFGAAVIALGLWGPVAVVREWLTKFALGAVVVTTAWLTWRLLDRADLGALWAAPRPGASVLGGVDIVIAMPISWLPLVSDYSRFARRPAAAFWGTAAGYLVANVWFYSLGALILLPWGRATTRSVRRGGRAPGRAPDPARAARRRDRRGLGRPLLVRGLDPERASRGASVRSLVGGLGAVSILLALVFDVTRYEGFLLLIGAVFVPLFGVLAADYFVVWRGRYDPPGAPRATRAGGVVPGVRWQGALAWALGTVTYLFISGRLEPSAWPACRRSARRSRASASRRGSIWP